MATKRKSRSNTLSMSMRKSIMPSASDSRPLRDKEYQDAVMHDLITYLRQNDFPGQANEIMMHRTKKGYADIAWFLLDQISPGCKKTITRFKDEDKALLRVLKMYRIPLQGISPMTLQVAGAKEKWPQLLGLLASLLCIAKKKTALADKYQKDTKKDPKQEAFLKLASGRITHNEFNQVLGEQEKMIEKSNHAMEKLLAEKYTEIAAQEKILNDIRSEKTPAELRDKLKALEHSLSVLENSSKQKLVELSTLQENIIEAEKENNSVTLKQAEENRSFKELEKRILRQPFTPRGFAAEKRELEEKRMMTESLHESINALKESNESKVRDLKNIIFEMKQNIPQLCSFDPRIKLAINDKHPLLCLFTKSEPPYKPAELESALKLGLKTKIFKIASDWVQKTAEAKTKISAEIRAFDLQISTAKMMLLGSQQDVDEEFDVNDKINKLVTKVEAKLAEAIEEQANLKALFEKLTEEIESLKTDENQLSLKLQELTQEFKAKKRVVEDKQAVNNNLLTQAKEEYAAAAEDLNLTVQSLERVYDKIESTVKAYQAAFEEAYEVDVSELFVQLYK